MRTTSPPAPSTLAPIFASTSASSATSGSRAAFRITVSPRARVAAIMRFSVAPTEGKARSMTAPFSSLARASM